MWLHLLTLPLTLIAYTTCCLYIHWNMHAFLRKPPRPRFGVMFDVAGPTHPRISISTPNASIHYHLHHYHFVEAYFTATSVLMIRSSCVQHGPLLPNSSSTRLSIRTPRHIARFSSDKQHQTSPTNTAAVTSAGLFESLRADAAFAKQLEDPGFEYIVRSHLLLHDVVTKAVPLHRAPTKGVYGAWCT